MEKIKDAARKSGQFIVVDSDLNFNSPVIRINVDRSKANDLGITMQSIGDTLAVMVGGNYINRFNFNGRSYEVIPQVPRIDRLSPTALSRYYVKTASGDQVPLSTVVSISTGVEPNALSHYNQLPSATFQAVPMPGVTIGQAVDFLEQAAERVLPREYSHAYLGQSRQYVTEGNQLTITFGFALIVIFLVLAAQFESLRDPLVILISVPMSICGALLPLFIGVASVNIYTQVGLVTLIGLISKHGILMVAFANDLQRNEDMDRRSRHRAVGARPTAPDPHDHRRDGRRPGAAALRLGRRRREPLQHRHRHRRRHADRHAVHAVRAAGGLHLDRPRPPPGGGRPPRRRDRRRQLRRADAALQKRRACFETAGRARLLSMRTS